MSYLIDNYDKFKEIKRKELILTLDFDSLGWDRKKDYLKFENNQTCQKCGLNEWMGEKIPLEIDHIDGDNSNNIKDNLRVLCPNCHALTSNWRGRNKQKKRLRIPNKVLLEMLIKNDWNFRQSLIDVGLSPKGGNYNRCHKIKRDFEELNLIDDEKLLIDITKEEFIDAVNKCSSIRMLAKYLKISYGRAYTYMKNYGCEFVKLEKNLPSLGELIQSFIELKSFKKLGENYGVSDNGVRKWFIKYGIDPKKMKDYL